MPISTPGGATHLDRAALIEWYRRNRGRSAEIFDWIDPSAFDVRPIPLRHPFVFYEGHLPAFSVLTLNVRALGEPPVDAELERLFERGIDPGTLEDARRHERADWPSRERIAAFAAACDARVERAFACARLVDDAVPRLRRGQAAFTVLEHEQMHHETLTYIVHQLDPGQKRFVAQTHADGPSPAMEIRDVPAGIATLGALPDDIAFGWDNEFAVDEQRVAAFGIMRYPVTNAQWLDFVRDGGPVPQFWVPRPGSAFGLRTVFETIDLPRAWPAYVTHDQAEAYARWAGMRLPNEAEYHRAAFGTRAGIERPHPWGDEPPAARHGNFGFRRYDPEPVDAHPDGRSDFGVDDLVGNGWEWTSTPFGPLPGFEPMASYPQYSTDFFDGKHYVMKGASPVTATELVRRSFRNWFYGDYPYMYAKFRCVAA